MHTFVNLCVCPRSLFASSTYVHQCTYVQETAGDTHVGRVLYIKVKEVYLNWEGLSQRLLYKAPSKWIIGTKIGIKISKK